MDFAAIFIEFVLCVEEKGKQITKQQEHFCLINVKTVKSSVKKTRYFCLTISNHIEHITMSFLHPGNTML